MSDEESTARAARRPPRRRRRKGEEAGARVRASAFVAVVLGALLVMGALVRPGSRPEPASVSFGRLPSVSLTSSASAEWDCPGPLPAGASPSRSSIVIANPGRRPDPVVVDGAALSPSLTGGGTPAGSWRLRLTVAPETERALPLPTTGPAREDAVSVVSESSSVAVFESVASVVTEKPAGDARGHRVATTLLPPRQAACSVGPTAASYLAYGSTAGRSDVLLSLFNPTATQAVAEIRVATPTAAISPPELQGLIVRPYSLQVFDLARSVVQQPVVGVAVSTSAGRVAFGASESIASDVTSPTSVSGQALLVGVPEPQSTWVMSPGLSFTHRTEIVCVYDPGTVPALVTVSSRIAGGTPTEESAVIPAGTVRSVMLPVGPPSSKGASTTTGLVEGPIVVRTARDVGVVVARVEERLIAPRTETFSVAAASAAPSAAWMLPLASGTALSPSAAEGGLLVANPGTRAAVVEVLRLSVPGARRPVFLAGLSVAAGATRQILLELPLKGSAFAGLEVVSALPVVVEQAFGSLPEAGSAGSKPQPASTEGPLPLQGVPIIG